MSKVNFVRCAAGALAISLALAACGSSGGTKSPDSGAVGIVSFVVPATVKCGPALNAQVPVSYAVENARSQKLVVDGHVQKGTDAASRTMTVAVPCDNQRHTIAFVVGGTRGHLLGRTKHVTTVRRAG